MERLVQLFPPRLRGHHNFTRSKGHTIIMKENLYNAFAAHAKNQNVEFDLSFKELHLSCMLSERMCKANAHWCRQSSMS